MNAAKCPTLDTNREAPGNIRESGADILDAITDTGLHDVFRTKHPTKRAWTRMPTGDLAQVQAARRIDHVMATSEIAQHLATRIGIHHDFHLETDHRPVVVDIPLDCAGLADRVVPVWRPNTVEKLVKNKDITRKDAEDYRTPQPWRQYCNT